MPRALCLALAALALAGCKSEIAMSIDITAGLEADAFDGVDHVDVTVTSLDETIKATVSARPGESFDVGVVKADQQISVDVTGFDAAGATVLRGRSLSGLPLDAIEGGLAVFVQRVGAWARPPGAIAHAHVGGIGAAVGDRFVFVTRGAEAAKEGSAADASAAEWYDFFALGTSTSKGFTPAPESLVSFGEALFILDGTSAKWIDYTTQKSYAATAPIGLAYADVAGGAAVTTNRDDGRAYLVGGTRRGAATTAVLAVNSDGTLAAYQLTIARKGAAAIWVSGVGLVVAGGSDVGSGVEVLSDAGTSFSATDHAADPVEGAAAVLQGSGVALIGGQIGGKAAPTRIVDPGCVASCTVKELPDAGLPSATARTTAYSLGGTRVIVVADESAADGMTRAFLVDLVGEPSLTELPFKEPRRGAISVPTPLGGLSVLGGEHADGTPATSVELFFTQ